MHKLATCLLLSAVVAAPAAADTLGEHFAGVIFSSQGQCNSALMAERNNRRATGEAVTGTPDGSVYNRAVHDKYVCAQIDKRTWIIVIDTSYAY